MYRIMLADDEGIVIDSLKFIIEKNYKDDCIVDFAKTGRSVIELAESFRPDIIFMDIQMPGINGIDAMREIKKNSQGIVFIVMSAYDKFDYAKEAINLGVMEYLHKPVNSKKIVEVIEKAMGLIDEQRARRSDDLRIKEKLEFVVPVIENGLVSAILLQQNLSNDTDKYKELLGIKENYGFMIILEYGDSIEGRKLTNPVGTSFMVQQNYPDIRTVLKEYFHCAVGPIMTNKIVCFVPHNTPQEEYESRSEVIQKGREMIHRLNHRYEIRFRLGIGSVTSLTKLTDSYRDAANALRNSDGSVAHCRDLPLFCVYEDNYPIDLEKKLFEEVSLGRQENARDTAILFFSIIKKNYSEFEMDIKLKILEFVLLAEHIAYQSGGMTYHFRDRKDYLPGLLEMKSAEDMQFWFAQKIEEAASNVNSKKFEYSNIAIEKARKYIHSNFKRDISLDNVSREVDMSSYYFSKLFKEVTGENFVEYVTKIRMETAKKFLQEGKLTIKEICVETGYTDPNYFSRIFKKYVGTTPTEFRGA